MVDRFFVVQFLVFAVWLAFLLWVQRPPDAVVAMKPPVATPRGGAPIRPPSGRPAVRPSGVTPPATPPATSPATPVPTSPASVPPVGGLPGGDFPAMAPSGRLQSFPEAQRRATAEAKPIVLVALGTGWCRWSERLQREVLSGSEFAALAQRAVVMECDLPDGPGQPVSLGSQNSELVSRFTLAVIPTILVLEPDGRERGRLEFPLEAGRSTIPELRRLLP